VSPVFLGSLGVLAGAGNAATMPTADRSYRALRALSWQACGLSIKLPWRQPWGL